MAKILYNDSLEEILMLINRLNYMELVTANGCIKKTYFDI